MLSILRSKEELVNSQIDRHSTTNIYKLTSFAVSHEDPTAMIYTFTECFGSATVESENLNTPASVYTNEYYEMYLEGEFWISDIIHPHSPK